MNFVLDAAANCTLTFSILLGALFVVGMFVIADRVFFFARYGWQLIRPEKALLTGSFAGANVGVSEPDAAEEASSSSVFRVFAEKALEFRLTSKELVYTLDITNHAQEEAVRQKLGMFCQVFTHPTALPFTATPSWPDRRPPGPTGALPAEHADPLQSLEPPSRPRERSTSDDIALE